MIIPRRESEYTLYFGENKKLMADWDRNLKNSKKSHAVSSYNIPESCSSSKGRLDGSIRTSWLLGFGRCEIKVSDRKKLRGIGNYFKRSLKLFFPLRKRKTPLMASFPWMSLSTSVIFFSLRNTPPHSTSFRASHFDVASPDSNIASSTDISETYGILPISCTRADKSSFPSELKTSHRSVSAKRKLVIVSACFRLVSPKTRETT